MGASECLGSFVSLIRGTTYKGVLVGVPGPALLGLGAITPGGGFREGDFKTYGGDCPEKLLLGPGDLFVSLKGATKDGEMIGSVARVPASVPSGRLTQDTVKLDFKSGSTAFRSYIYWLLRTPHYRQYCAARATGSAVVALSREDFLAYEVPPLDTSRGALVALFDAVEEKIRVNRRMCQTLEEMARALFRSWFVDFDPVRAKMEGRNPGLPKEIADLFPSRLVDSELGPIPEGWRVQTFDDVLTISRLSIDPQEHQAERFAHYSIPAFDAGMRAAIEVGESIKSQKLLVSDRHALISKLNPRTPRVWLPPHDGMLQQVASTEFLVCEPRHESGFTRTILYHAAASPRTIEFLAGNATGTSNSHQRVRPSDFLSYAFASPAIKLLRAFSEIAEPLHARIAAARGESHTLAQTRDTLLPKLISGELRVPASLGSMQEVAS
jgi:type I restriction enzyme S subunit